MEVGPAETSPQHVDDSVPLAFLLGKKFNYYMDPHLHTATLEERPRTPTDFHDMSKRQRELRAKMVLDPLSHNDEMLSGEVFQSIPARRAWKKERIKTAIATSNATDNQPRAFLAVAARPVPTIHDKANAVKQEAQNARLKQQWRMIHDQRIQSIAMEQREYAQHLLSMMEHPRQANNTAKSAMSQKREELERVKKHQEAELALVKEEKERALAELRRDIEYRNQTAKMKKTVVTKKQLPMEKAKLYKLDENGATLEDQFDSTDAKIRDEKPEQECPWWGFPYSS
ncbi:hypothetical protein AeRB84_002595 [Aphanomyces euteiches]|nr:hypothetical protein AeRB84_002595 [Aphanomyces euteiches]